MSGVCFCKNPLREPATYKQLTLRRVAALGSTQAGTTMPRFRRYRVFLIFAATLIFILYRLSQRTNNGEFKTSLPALGGPSPNDAFTRNGLGSKGKEVHDGNGQVQGDMPPKDKKVVDIQGLAHPEQPPRVEGVIQSTKLPTRPISSTSIDVPTGTLEASSKSFSEIVEAVHSKSNEASEKQTAPSIPTVPTPGFPAQAKATAPAGIASSDTVLSGGPATYTGQSHNAGSVIHWEKTLEQFPLSEESLINLPSGTPKTMPRIQFDFPPEQPEAKLKREERRSAVKAEFLHAWNGYKTGAWTHDEVMPVTGGTNDPFCGWAATMVDALDTLWIMELKDEFEEAVLAVDKIDFTTTHREQIPVFETTIRYLGGLLAAYDISGAKYPILLKKATELGEILMGVFDTPNRMPLLHYSWKPAFASQPHRASTRANFAELGSLTMEFTRLAQLTGEHKYYDSVARITNELVDWQRRGTKMKGVFPDSVDASGCNKTIPVIQEASTKQEPTTSPKEYQSTYNEEPASNVYDTDKRVELEILPGNPSRARIEPVGPDEDVVAAANPIERRQDSDPQGPIGNSNVTLPTMNQAITKPTRTKDASTQLNCVPQGLTGDEYVRESFSMGGGQDSTYEYFSKMWLLLGGLEEKYKGLYLGTMDAVKDYMLYRPMIPQEDRSILFSAKVGTYGHPENKEDRVMTYEVTHLTCFLGGMVGMGAKLFDLSDDMSIAERLSDGCVWAYDATASGIMPEDARAVPCESVTNCTWDESLWHRYLDPSYDTRNNTIRLYEEQKEARAKKAAEAAKAEQIRLEAEKEKAIQEEKESAARTTTSDTADVPYSLSGSVASNEGTANKDIFVESNGVSRTTTTTADTISKRAPPIVPPISKVGFGEKLAANEAELNPAFSNRKPVALDPKYKSDPIIDGVPRRPTTIDGQSEKAKLDRHRPLTHEEYVRHRIAYEKIPKGFAGVNSPNYILRPEAIESVWYMHRITGSPIWAEKGWKMFNSIINATRTAYGHSAITGVTTANPVMTNSMESFWLAETLKYFYLLYSEPDVVSLDDWVLNTEAHPFKRPDQKEAARKEDVEKERE